MQDTELFLSLAEIAGVFVGFGALIAVRTGGASDRHEIAYMRTVVMLGMLTIIAGLAPVTLGRYELAPHDVWVLSSAVYLAGLVVMVVAIARTPEYQAGWADEIEVTRTGQRARWATMAEGIAYVALMLALVLIPILIVLGVAPPLEAALYLTVVVLLLIAAGWTLLSLVLAPRQITSA